MANGFKNQRDNIVHYAIYLIVAFIILSSVLSFWNRYVTNETRRTIYEIEKLRKLVSAIETDIIDKISGGIQVYIISRQPEKLVTYQKALNLKDSIFSELKNKLEAQKYPLESFTLLEKNLDAYIVNSQALLQRIKSENDSTTLAEVTDFLNNQVLKKEYTDFSAKLTLFEAEIEKQAQSDYEWSITDNAIIQIILVVLSIPILLVTSKRLKNEVMQRNNLLRALDENNKQYLYNDGTATSIDAHSIVEKTIDSLKKGFLFVEYVAKGKHKEAQTLVPNNIRELNNINLMGALLRMSSKLQNVEDEDKNRQWVADGLNEFYGIVRNNQNNLNILTDKATSFLTKYLNSQQGSLFILKQIEGEEFLELLACYAFEKKKWIEKKIHIGTGLVGQAFLEGEPTLLTEVPNGYTQITSGLGHSTPTCILIVPLQYNEKTEAVFEVAGFEKYKQYQIEFLKKAGEFLAAALQNVKSNIEMQTLLRQSQEQAEILKSQEEELKQNMEELEATNEAMNRREREFNSKL
jgi:CHASE3 domain sensor protein